MISLAVFMTGWRLERSVDDREDKTLLVSLRGLLTVCVASFMCLFMRTGIWVFIDQLSASFDSEIAPERYVRSWRSLFIVICAGLQLTTCMRELQYWRCFPLVRFVPNSVVRRELVRLKLWNNFMDCLTSIMMNFHSRLMVERKVSFWVAEQAGVQFEPTESIKRLTATQAYIKFRLIANSSC